MDVERVRGGGIAFLHMCESASVGWHVSCVLRVAPTTLVQMLNVELASWHGVLVRRGWCHLLEEDYEWVTAELCKVGKEYASGRVVSVLEGGYHVERQAGPPPKSRAKKAAAAATGSENTPGALATSCAAHVSALMRA
jgi:hypothetical protein